MPAIQTHSAHAAFTANGGADGYVTVTDATLFWPGARVWVKSATVDSKECIITDVTSANKIGVRAVKAPYGGAEYGRTDMSAYLLADSATIDQAPHQAVPAELTNLGKP